VGHLLDSLALQVMKNQNRSVFFPQTMEFFIEDRQEFLTQCVRGKIRRFDFERRPGMAWMPIRLGLSVPTDSIGDLIQPAAQ